MENVVPAIKSEFLNLKKSAILTTGVIPARLYSQYHFYADLVIDLILLMFYLFYRLKNSVHNLRDNRIAVGFQ